MHPTAYASSGALLFYLFYRIQFSWSWGRPSSCSTSRWCSSAVPCPDETAASVQECFTSELACTFFYTPSFFILSLYFITACLIADSGSASFIIFVGSIRPGILRRLSRRHLERTWLAGFRPGCATLQGPFFVLSVPKCAAGDPSGMTADHLRPLLVRILSWNCVTSPLARLCSLDLN